ncbi:MAG: FMN-binding protein [Candidatus Riflemargulisbacteria bacterium]
MSQENKNSSILQITLNFTLASLLSGAILAGTYFITEPYSVSNKIKLKELSMRELIPTAQAFKQIANKNGWYKAMDNKGNLVGYILPAETKGYGGTIKILVAIDAEQKIIDYKILAHNETPGLGDASGLPEFRKQFAGKKPENLIVVKTPDPTKIVAITGATISSRAVTKGIKECLEQFDGLIKENGGGL